MTSIPSIEQLHALVEKKRTARDLIFKGAGLREIDLTGMRGDNLDFEEADLRNSALSGAKWKSCVLRDARLEGADLSNATIRVCTLDQARADNANFSYSHLENSTACGARFDNANFASATLTDTNFSRASFRGANMEGVSATGADFRGADLHGVNLHNAVLADSDFRGADLTGANLSGADMTGADLRGAIMDEAPGTKNEQGMLPPELQKVAVAVSPVVASLLRKGEAGGVTESEAQTRVMEILRNAGWADSSLTPSPSKLDGEIDAILKRVAETGIGPLLEALRQGEDAPPKAVATLLEKLFADFKLGEEATADDLVIRLADSFKRNGRKVNG